MSDNQKRPGDSEKALELGARVSFSKQLVRVTKPCDKPRRWAKGWDRVSWYGPQEGIVVGLRTLQEGEVVPGGGYFDEYEPNRWRLTAIVPAVLVAVNLRHKPVYVHRDDCQRLVPVSDSLEEA